MSISVSKAWYIQHQNLALHFIITQGSKNNRQSALIDTNLGDKGPTDPVLWSIPYYTNFSRKKIEIMKQIKYMLILVISSLKNCKWKKAEMSKKKKK